MRILSEVTFPSEKKKTKFPEFEKAFRLLTGEPSFKWYATSWIRVMNQVPNKHWFNFQLGATRRQCMHTTNIFSSDEITCAYLHSSVQARLWELWTETDQPKGVENMYAEGSNSTVTYVKEIKLYLVISTITSSLKQFQQLFLSGASECLWFLRKSTKNFILSDASKCLLFRANFHWRQRFVLFATFLVINFPGILKK